MFNNYLSDAASKDTLGVDDVVRNLQESLAESSAETIADAYNKTLSTSTVDPLSDETYRRKPDGSIIDGDDALKAIGDALTEATEGKWIAEIHNMYSSAVIKYLGDSMFEEV